jgi:monoterpene epsilon-lactone hydrolase
MKAMSHVSACLGLSAAGVAIALTVSTSSAAAQTPPREVLARTIPVPETVSPQMQKLIAAPLTPTWNVIPTTPEECKAQVNAVTVATLQTLPALREALHVKVEPTTIDGVKVYTATPETIPPENRNRLLVHVHGGCFVSFPGEPEQVRRQVQQRADLNGSLADHRTGCRCR